MSFPKTKPPHNVRVLHRWIGEYARAHGQAESRLKRTIDYMLVALALDRARDDAGQRMFAIKGGVSMELRLPRAARTTQDLDAVFLGAFEAWLETLDDVLEEPVADFLFSRGEPERIGRTRTMRLTIHVDYRGRRWGTVLLEVAPAEAIHVLDVDEIPPFDIGQFGLPTLERTAVVGLPYLVAQKLHACTESLAGRDNPRVRDLVDLLLARELLDDQDLPRVREACVAIFEGRDTHTWPPALSGPPSWEAAYARLASEHAPPAAADLDEALAQVRRFIEAIDRAATRRI